MILLLAIDASYAALVKFKSLLKSINLFSSSCPIEEKSITEPLEVEVVTHSFDSFLSLL